MKEKLKLLLNGSEEDITSFISRYLNDDMSNFFKLLLKYGLLNDEINETLLELYPMNYLRYLYMDNRERTIDEIVSGYSDINKKGDRYFLTLSNREDLSSFFEPNDGYREMSSQELSRHILGEDWYEPFMDVTQDIYEDVIEELDDKNKFIVAESISKELSGELLSPDTELLQDIANDQGHPDYVDVKNPKLVMDILENDSKSSNILLNEASDVSNNLYSLHNNAYNSAYSDEKYNEVMNELKHLLDIDNVGDWVSKKVTNYKGEEKTIYNYVVEVTKFIPFLFSSIFNDDYQMDDYRNAFEYYGDFENLVKEMINEDVIDGAEISRNYYDYADPTLVSQYLNDMIIDYL